MAGSFQISTEHLRSCSERTLWLMRHVMNEWDAHPDKKRCTKETIFYVFEKEHDIYRCIDYLNTYLPVHERILIEMDS